MKTSLHMKKSFKYCSLEIAIKPYKIRQKNPVIKDDFY